MSPLNRSRSSKWQFVLFFIIVLLEFFVFGRFPLMHHNEKEACLANIGFIASYPIESVFLVFFGLVQLFVLVVVTKVIIARHNIMGINVGLSVLVFLAILTPQVFVVVLIFVV